jgi:hypothetical protein
MNFALGFRRAIKAPETQAKCTFVYSNNRVLQRFAPGQPRYSWWTLTEEKLQELDELVYEAWKGGGMGEGMDEGDAEVEGEMRQDKLETQTLFENGSGGGSSCYMNIRRQEVGRC